MKKLIRLIISLLTTITLAALIGCAGLSKAKSPNNIEDSDASAQVFGADEAGDFDDTISAAETESPKELLRAPANHVYYFAFDDSNVSDMYIASIKAQANYLLRHPNARIRLEGHTDARGSREYNIALGWRRAKALAQLIKQKGVSPKQLALVSYGKERPVSFGSNERAWQQNRRAVLVYERR